MKLSHLAAFLAGVLIVLVAGIFRQPAQAAVISTQTPLPPTPTVTQTVTPTRYPTATITPTITATPKPTQMAIAGVKFGWPGEVQCWNCSPFSARVKLSHYNPQRFDPDFPRLNCWNFSEKFDYCLSPTWIGVPWDSVWGIGAACPSEWATGTWVEIPAVGSFICFDHGEDIRCDYDSKICRVDLLGPGGEDWDNQEFDATLWVPTSYLLRSQDK